LGVTVYDSQPQDLPRLVVMASGRGSNLERVLAACAEGTLAASVVGVIVNVPGCGAIGIAEAAGVPVRLLDHRAYDGRAAQERAVAEALDAWRPALVVLAGYMRILSPWLIDRLRVPGLGFARVVNIHPADPARYRGPDGYGWALEAGLAQTTVTVHWVDEGLDSGPIIAQAAVPVLPGDSLDALRVRGLAVEHDLYPPAIGVALRRLQEVPTPCAAF
jgi:phosphoribosylglycinamide formyltransferase-1